MTDSKNQAATPGTAASHAAPVKDFSSFSPRERILAAALKLFVEQGYFNTNIPDLSRESKCSVGSIYHTFKNKEEIARELYREAMAAFRGALQEAIPDDAEVSIVIKKTVKSFLKFSEVNHQLSRYIWLCRHNEFMTGIIRHPAMVGFDKLGRKLTRNIKRGIRSGLVRPLKAHILWSILFGIPVGYVREWLDGYNTEPPGAVAEELAESCWRALKR